MSYKKHNTIIGTVIKYNNFGCYVRDEENGFIVFYYGNGMVGDKVQLSVSKVDRELHRVTCNLDTVLEYGAFVA